MKTREELLAAAEELERAIELTPDGMLSQARYLRNLAAQASQVPEQEPGVFVQPDLLSNKKITVPLYTHPAPAPTEHTAADAPSSNAGNLQALKAAKEPSAVGVPDVAGLIERLRNRATAIYWRVS